MLEASTSSWGFWQANAEFPPQTVSFQATKVVLGTATLWRDQSTSHTGRCCPAPAEACCWPAPVKCPVHALAWELWQLLTCGIGSAGTGIPP